MDDDLARRSHELLNQAFELDTDARRSFVEAACAGDTRLRNRVSKLLSALEDSQCFLETPALQATTPQPPAVAEIPQRIGSYRIVRVLGSGGMATVYEAIQAQPERRVALKVPHQAWHHAPTIHRFRYESAVLARLQHPGIAQIFEAGVWEPGSGVSLPYLAMEFVVGAQPITDFAQQRKLTCSQRLRMFATVCEAVHYGHRHGVIHRDLKPANILVDHEGRPKVIDFGVARSNDAVQGYSGNGTNVGQLVGTLNFMSPEQCASDSVVDARTDVYSLGVILYALLCDRLPHNLSGVPLPEALRIVQQDPPRRPASLDQRLRGDLDAIVLKAIEKDPQRRYPSVDALEADIHRFLNHQTVDARPPTILYQCQMFARRNRVLVASAVAVCAAVVLGAILSTVFAVRMYRESQLRLTAEQEAIQQRDEALWHSYIANIASGFSAFQTHEFQQLRNRLARAPEQHRSWEWRFLAGMAEVTERTIDAHEDMIFGFATNRDGTLGATACRDGTFKVWDMAMGSSLATLEPMGDGDESAAEFAAQAVAFSTDGEHVVSGNDDGAVCVWNAATGELIRQVGEHDAAILQVACAPNDVIASASQDGAAHLWDGNTGDHLRALDRTQGKIQGVVFSEDGNYLVTWNHAGSVWLRSGDDSAVHHRWSFDGTVECVVMSPDNQWVAAGGSQARILVWNVTSGEPRELKIASHVSTIRSLAFSKDSAVLAAGQVDRGTVLWRVSDGTSIGQVRGHEEAVSGLGFSDDGEKLYSTSWDRTIRVWNLASTGPMGNVSRLDGHQDYIFATTFSPDGSILASGSRDKLVRLWDPDLGETVGVLRGHRGSIFSISFSPHERIMATGSTDRTVRLWDTTTGEPLETFDEPRGAVWSVEFSPDGLWLAGAGDDAVIRIWDVGQRKLLHTLAGHRNRVIKIAISPDGKRLASASRDQSVLVWDPASGNVLHELTGHKADVFALTFNRDGTRLYSGSRDQTVRVWDPSTGDCQDVLGGHGQFVTSLSINPDGTRLAAGSWFGEIVLWDIHSHDIVASFKGHPWAIRAVAFSPDGRYLASGSYDKEIRLFGDFTHEEQQARRETALQRTEMAKTIVDELFERYPEPDQVASALESNLEIAPDVIAFARKQILRRATSDAIATQP